MKKSPIPNIQICLQSTHLGSIQLGAQAVKNCAPGSRDFAPKKMCLLPVD